MLATKIRKQISADVVTASSGMLAAKMGRKRIVYVVTALISDHLMTYLSVLPCVVGHVS